MIDLPAWLMTGELLGAKSDEHDFRAESTICEADGFHCAKTSARERKYGMKLRELK